MSATLDCPGIEHWQALLGERPSAQDWESYERHLESCPACQERLHRAEECGDDLRSFGRRSGDPTASPADPALARALERLREAKSPHRPAAVEWSDLYFLRPTEEPGLLGTLGNYEVQEVIGQGGMGIVLAAYEPALHRLVAIKVLSPALAGSATARRRFAREAQAAAAVCHEHVVAVHGVHEADGLPYLVMQFVPGESLQTRLERGGPLEVTEVVRIGMQTAAGLAAAHAQGLIHRDIKPANLLLEDGLAKVKITDFGLARTADDVGLTRDGVVAGTPEYMAPEQARCETVDHRADLFSLGSVLYAMCTGAPSFRGSTALAVLRQVCEQAPTPIRSLNPEVPAWLEALVARLLAKDPAQRFGSAAEVADLLEGYLAHLQQPAAFPVPELPPSVSAGNAGPSFPGSNTRAVRPFLQRHWLPVLLGLAALGLSLLFLVRALAPEQPPAGPQPAPGEFYQDFRGGRGLDPSLRLVGPDVDDVSKPEAEGLRITLPATRPVNHPVEVVTEFAVSGDFEITATYELLSATRPDKGYGVGVALNIADSDARNTFAKIMRAKVAREGNVFLSEYWTKGARKDYQTRTKPTQSRGGQLRLVRKGPALRFLAADGMGGDFQEIYSQDQFGTDDMAHVRFVVADSGRPGNAVDARLVDLRIRSGNPLPEPAPDSAAPGAPQHPSGSKIWLAAAGILGVVILLAALGVWLVVRSRDRAGREEPGDDPVAESPAPAAGPPALSFACSACGKKLKGKLQLAGKSVQCPACKATVQVPADPSSTGFQVNE
jgi:serine/threonine protein kinase